jgi:hypothetical protein
MPTLPNHMNIIAFKNNGLTYIQTNNTTFLHMETPPTTIWIRKAISYSIITPNLNHKYLHQLLLLNITTLEQIILLNRTTIMNKKEFQQYHNKITPTIKKALKIASQLFCITYCTVTYQPPCNIHQQTFTLLPEIINRPNQNFLHTPLVRINPPINMPGFQSPLKKCKDCKTTPSLPSQTLYIPNE